MTDQSKALDAQNKGTEIATITPMAMVQLALERGADLDQIQKFMDLAERQEANEAKKAYVKSMSKFRAKCPDINRTKKAHNSNYAGLSETISQIKSLLSKCGLSHSWRTSQQDNIITVSCYVTHELGHQECTSLSSGPDKTGSKNEIQAIASTVSYLERYTLYAILGLASKEMDTDGNLPAEYISKEQAKIIYDLIDETGSDELSFCKYCKVVKVEDITTKQYSQTITMLERKRGKK